MDYPKKLIEVALPLDEINYAAAREKSIRHGHPSSVHLWWARRPLAAARAVLFAQLVNDPGGKRGYGAYKGQTKEQAQKERERLFNVIRDLVKWENINNEEVLKRARDEIVKSWEETCKITGDDPSKLPAFHDPFAGGGAIPFEAQRLGLEAYASDLNPVAVLINKAMIEIPPKFTGKPAVNPEAQSNKMLFKNKWSGVRGLAEDIAYYAKWMRDEAERKTAYLYPKIEITAEMAKNRNDLKGYIGKKLTVIAWIWARTVRSPNPAYAQLEVPLASTFMLSTKVGKEVYINPIIGEKGYHFEVKVGIPKNIQEAKSGTKIAHGANFKCIMSGVPISGDYIKSEGKAGRMGARLLAIVAEGERGRVYVSPTSDHEIIPFKAKPAWKPEVLISGSTQYLGIKPYGMDRFDQIFTNRQLTTLHIFSDLIQQVSDKVRRDALEAGFSKNEKPLRGGGLGAVAYGEAIATYLSFLIDQQANQLSTCCGWNNINQQMIVTFSMQALQMKWDFAECNPFSRSTGSFTNLLERQAKGILSLGSYVLPGTASQMDATSISFDNPRIIATDPPYYDNVPYADLSDFFYVWLRKSLQPIYPKLFATLTVPKGDELVAFAYRHGSKEEAEIFFRKGMLRAMLCLFKKSHPAFPITIFYAFKQAESDKFGGRSSTGWEVFLTSLIQAGFTICGTWPMKTESANKLKAQKNVLASSIILVCRRRANNASSISRRDFLRELKDLLPEALEDMIGIKGMAPSIAPVDLAQAAIGPGMAIFSKYKVVLEADGSPMSVHDALIHINRAIDDYFTEAEGEMDSDTRFCIDWFQQYGFKEGVFGESDVLARAKGTSVEGVQEAGVIFAKAGKVKLLKVSEYPENWDPETDKRTPVWEACHHMCRALQISETKAGELLARMPEKAESIRQLAYRLYTLCERKGWAEDAGLYNSLITSWHAILEESHKVGHVRKQKTLFDM